MKVTKDELLAMAMEAVQEDRDLGVCHGCGHTQDGCEPDARKLECEACGEPQVYGGEETLVMLGI